MVNFPSSKGIFFWIFFIELTWLQQPESFYSCGHLSLLQPAQVTDLGSASLSWVRLAGPSLASSHLTVLSSGTTLFSSSPRLSLLHSPDSPDWTLQIGPLLARDQGTYECQANTEPKVASDKDSWTSASN